MRHEFSFDFHKPLVRVKASGIMTPASFNRQFRHLVDHPDWQPGTNILSDYTEIDGSRLTAEDVRGMAGSYRALADRIGPGRSAIVVSEALEFGLARMWVSWAEMKIPREVRVFTSMSEAEAWVLEDCNEKERASTRSSPSNKTRNRPREERGR